MRKHLEFKGDRWEGGEIHEYKGNRDVIKHVLFGERNGLDFEVRVFEVKVGGATSLERHEHQHAVLVLEGEGSALVGNEVYDVRPFDGIWVPPNTPHQFVANKGKDLKILCVVNVRRDRPKKLSDDELKSLLSNPRIANIIRVS